MLQDLRRVLENLFEDTMWMFAYADSLLRSTALKLKALSEDRMVRLVLVYTVLALIVFFSAEQRLL